MNDDFSDLEAELKRFRPRAPSAELRSRLAAVLDQPVAPNARAKRTHARILSWLFWKQALWPSATFALVVFVFSLAGRNQSLIPPSDAGMRLMSGANLAAPAPDIYKPVSAENVLYEASDEELVVLDDGTAARRVFERYLDTYTWRNPRTNASLRWTVPRDEVRVIPVRAY